MDLSDARRQVTEINAFQAQSKYAHAIEITTPALFNRLEKSVGGSTSSSNQHLPVKKCLSLKIKCRELDDLDELSGLILEIEFPLDYPSGSTCQIHAINNGANAAGVGTKITTYLESFVGCECLELVLDWLSDNNSTCLQCNNDASSDTPGMVECYILRYNHLLAGPEHKKEKAMVDTAKKSKLQGGLLWGTPGIVVVVPPSTEEDAKEYAVDSREIGKRPDGVESMHLPESGMEEAGLGGLAQQKRGGRLKDLDTATLRIACGGDEDLLRSVLGIR
eukprot:CAMPEP_0172326092 /NCGR_PEP_ID=MMETSP1058-20130122/55591_1 /TAXON_ID=83371 /ORGANISM="Detonula confervacea, Strain CCMP 353" /LENGTH=276 /DNA_ID=CAMNT_0013042797 /DNA_START=75 /DNA_END=905 /DNA_ORIENTATION=+